MTKICVICGAEFEPKPNMKDRQKYCSKNLQCSLTIEIKKIYGEKEKQIPYIIKTNVYKIIYLFVIR